jgi:hypothetical protein
MAVLANSVADGRVQDVRCNEHSLIVDLIDGRTISVPLAWYPRLLQATPDQRATWERAGAAYGIHWPGIDENLSDENLRDEDLSTKALLRGAPAPRAS